MGSATTSMGGKRPAEDDEASTTPNKKLCAGSTTGGMISKSNAAADVDTPQRKKVLRGEQGEVRGRQQHQPQRSPNPIIEGVDSSASAVVVITPTKIVEGTTTTELTSVITNEKKKAAAFSSSSADHDNDDDGNDDNDGSNKSKKKNNKTTKTATKTTKKKITDKKKMSPEIVYKEGFPTLLFGSDGGIQSSDPIVVEKAMEQIVQKIKIMPKLEDFITMGGPAIVMLNMKKWQQSKPIAKLCCETVALLLGRSNETSCNDQTAKLTELFHDLETFQMVGEAMGNHSLAAAADDTDSNKNDEEFSDLQWMGIVAWGNMLYANNPEIAEKLVRTHNGLTIITKGMEKFPHHQRLAQHSTWLLTRLAELGIPSSAMKQSNALVLVASAVQNFPKNRKIDKNAKNFFEQVFSQPPPPSKNKKPKKNGSLVPAEIESTASSVTTTTSTTTTTTTTEDNGPVGSQEGA